MPDVPELPLVPDDPEVPELPDVPLEPDVPELAAFTFVFTLPLLSNTNVVVEVSDCKLFNFNLSPSIVSETVRFPVTSKGASNTNFVPEWEYFKDLSAPATSIPAPSAAAELTDPL